MILKSLPMPQSLPIEVLEEMARLQSSQEKAMSSVPPRITKFLEENFPADDNLAGYVICIARRDKTMTVLQGHDSPEVRDKVGVALADHIAKWPEIGDVLKGA
ncbi:hypothetical protein IVB46_10155 [Bradyrhizobium sp. 61]|uniref:hypothetical protein n=1 Tax=Bradyrhizobium sp. 61 TaxID=2782679 RepID=UPI001FFC25D4|nr:hypothetical protein [Bradyrhizobium sp. 61]MCK1275593.1 hypothetical protein [Bradyrhizobium sp. 61]